MATRPPLERKFGVRVPGPQFAEHAPWRSRGFAADASGRAARATSCYLALSAGRRAYLPLAGAFVAAALLAAGLRRR